MRTHVLLLPALFGFACVLRAQEREPEAGLVALHQASLDASTDGVVLNVAAHPDDESSRTNTILRRKYGLRVVTVYSTYGDGGQNAIGRDLGPELAQLRVRETLRAAAMSDVEVRWLGMEDFGYSKTLDETLAVWGKDTLLAAMAKVVDEVDPDFVITNHSLDQGHGHHRASFWAIREVLAARAGKSKHLPPLYSRCAMEKAQVTFDPSELDAARGETYARLAHRAWTQHVTQGPFGPHNPLQVGKEYWQLVFPEGVDKEQAADPIRSWVRRLMLDGEKVALVEPGAGIAGKPFHPADAPAGAVPTLADLRRWNGLAVDAQPDAKAALARHVEAVHRLLLAQANVRIEAWLERDEVARGGEGKAFVVVHGFDKLQDVKVGCRGIAAEAAQTQARTTPFDAAPAGTEPPKRPAPPPPIPGRYTVRFVHEAGDDAAVDAGPRPVRIALDVSFTLDGTPIELHPRLWYTPVDPVEVEWDRDVVMVPKGQTVERIVSATVRSHRDTDFSEPVRLAMGPGIKTEAIPARVALSREHPEARVLVRTTFTTGELSDDAELRVEIAGKKAALRIVPVEVFVPPGLTVGLVRGPDDSTERALADLGVTYQALDRDALATARLEAFTTLLLDIRAYNHRPELAEHRDRILQFCRAGGRVVVMYHKSGEWNERAGHPLLAPFALTVGETRATEEQAPVTMLLPEHPLWHHPHTITAADFAGWVQERGLNFPSKWDPAWASLLELRDSGDEKPHLGALLHTQYGRGDFVFCALALYRQLRVGNPGACRLLVNLLAK